MSFSFIAFSTLSFPNLPAIESFYVRHGSHWRKVVKISGKNEGKTLKLQPERKFLQSSWELNHTTMKTPEVWD